MYEGDHAEGGDNFFLRWVWSVLIMVAVAIVLTFILNTFVLQPYEIPSGSMEKTIMTNDKVFTEKVSLAFRKPKAGDIVTFSDPQIDSRTLIKRVIAVEGDTIDIHDGLVFVNGERKYEDYTDGKLTMPLSTFVEGLTYPYKVPDGKVFVMGDNRENSQDSRYFGPISITSITGKAFMVYLPFEHLKFI